MVFQTSYGSLPLSTDERHSPTPTPARNTVRNLAVAFSLVIVFVVPFLSSSSSPVLLGGDTPILGTSFPADPLPYSDSFPTTFSAGKYSPVRKIKRPKDSSPGALFKTNDSPLPTNRWYQNLLIGTTPVLTETNKAYTIPYVVDPTFTSLSTSSTSGLMVHWTNVVPSGDKIVQVMSDPTAGVGLGVAAASTSADVPSPTYTISKTPSPLQVELDWAPEPRSIISTIESFLYSKKYDDTSPFLTIPVTRGAPYITANYSAGAIPLINSPILPVTAPYHPFEYFVMVDGKTKLNCTSFSTSSTST
eukprot:CAMPEP_0118633740 /NCGR_PEP_ID=MMETSP0785-20121206/1162_1 /TAXON_ID=91992 /ORGANISM="Bolidomonas pacifica, Strain CCMP 1866" /LENGTH=303 /DNA_ID=CAMNT_0006524643 /DNA_START=218 /DNA_END=1125 /DNA_ORIENTATION=-